MAFRFRRSLTTVLVLAACIGVPVGLIAFNAIRSAAMTRYFATMKPPPVPVTTEEARATGAPRDLPAIGTLQAVHQVTVAPEVGGRVVQIFFNAGDTVKAGDPLAQLNDAPLRGDLANYQAQARIAQLTLSRSSRLASRQFETQATLDQNHAQLDQANALIARTEAQIAQLLIKAPFGGRLGIRQIEAGQYLNPGGAVVTLTDLGRLYVNFNLPEQDRAQLSIGQAVVVTSDSRPGKSYKAVLTAIEPQISADTRMIALQATMDNPSQELLPGMFVDVAVSLPPQADAVTVPDTAIVYGLYGDSIYVLRRTGSDQAGAPAYVADRRFIHTGRRFNGRVVVDGVKDGDIVVTSGQINLANGAAVRISGEKIPLPTQVPVE